MNIMVQYDDLQHDYDGAEKRPSRQLEQQTVRSVLQPIIRDARVLELACGSGFFTYRLVEWGAKSVMAIDVSSKMIEAAKHRGRIAHSSSTGSVEFQLGDCFKPVLFDGGSFDLIVYVWVPIPDKKSLTDLFKTIHLNLKKGGKLVAVTSPVTNDPEKLVQAARDARPYRSAKSGIFVKDYKIISDGVTTVEIGYSDQTEDFEMDCYYLRQDVYEAAAKEAGFDGKLEWVKQSMPDKYLRGEDLHEIHAESVDHVLAFHKVPVFSVLTITK